MKMIQRASSLNSACGSGAAARATATGAAGSGSAAGGSGAAGSGAWDPAIAIVRTGIGLTADNVPLPGPGAKDGNKVGVGRFGSWAPISGFGAIPSAGTLMVVFVARGRFAHRFFCWGVSAAF